MNRYWLPMSHTRTSLLQREVSRDEWLSRKPQPRRIDWPKLTYWAIALTFNFGCWAALLAWLL